MSSPIEEALLAVRDGVDAHVHVYADAEAGARAKREYEIWEYGPRPGVAFSSATGTLDELVRAYEETPITRSVVAHIFDPHVGGAGNKYMVGDTQWLRETAGEAMMAQNLALLEAAHKCAGVEVLVSVDPRLVSKSAMEEHFRQVLRAGAKGVKLHPILQGLPVSDPCLARLYEWCSETGLPLLVHSGRSVPGVAPVSPGVFTDVLKKWPRLTLVLAHLGGGQWRESQAVAEAFANVYFDLSEIIEWVGAPGAPTVAGLTQLIRAVGPNRVMFGSDFPWYDPRRSAAWLCRYGGLDPGEVNAVMGETARAVYHLENGCA